MKRNIDQKLQQYSKINFQNDLDNLEFDVRRRMFARRSISHKFKIFIEGWLGMPISFGASAVVSMMFLGIFLGTQLPIESPHASSDELGLQIFSASNTKLPSSLLAGKQ